LTSSLLEKLILMHEEESGDNDGDDKEDNDVDEGGEERGVNVENEEKVDTTNYIHKFKTFVNWLSGNQNCSQELKEKIVNLFKLEHFTSSELSTCVRESSFYSDSELMDVLREKIEVMVSDYGALLKDKCSLVLENLDFERKLTKVEKEKIAFEQEMKSFKPCTDSKHTYISG